MLVGFQAEIHRATWERPKIWGAPRLWTHCWTGVLLWAELLVLYRVGLKWAVFPFVVWGLGQLLMIYWTTQDDAWDDVWLAQLTRRYRAFYEAG
jgi:hypothetical protein